MPVGAWFGTEVDEPAVVATLPAVLSRGDDPAVAVVDQVARAAEAVGRVTGDAGTLLLRVEPRGGPLRVRVELRLDDTATRWWADRVRPPRGQAERPRLVLLRSQGRTRAGVVLARRQGWLAGVDACGTVAFDLEAQEVADGLVVVELAAPRLPAWASDRLSVDAPTGLRLDRIVVEEATGTPPVDAAPPRGALVVVPAGAQHAHLVRYSVPPAPPPPRAPGNRWTRQLPARAAFKVLRTLRRVAGRAAATVTPPAFRAGRLRCLAVDLGTGADVGVIAEPAGRHGIDIRITTPVDGPVLLGLVDPAGVRRERTARQPAWRPM